MLLLRSDCSEPAVSLVQDDAKDQEPSGMWDYIVGGCVIHFWNQCNQRNQESWDFHEKMIFFGLRAGLVIGNTKN